MTTEMQIVRPQGGAVQVARQGFGEQSMERHNTAAAAMAERARAEVQARYIVALQRPRNVDEFRVRLLAHCKRPRFAKAARYSKPVGGTTIEGASIRFVEAALAEYTNNLPESAIVFEDDTQIVVRVSVTDLEKNITHAGEATIAKRMERRRLKSGQVALSQRVNSYGDVVYMVEATDDDVANMKAARESKLLRNLGLRILPADVVDEAMDQCVATLLESASKDPTAERKLLVDSFFAIGVSPTHLAEYIGHPIDQLQPAELLELRYVYQAIRDGEATWSASMAAKRAQSPAVEPPLASGTPVQGTPVPDRARGMAAAKAQLEQRATQRQRRRAADTVETPPPSSSPAAGPTMAPGLPLEDPVGQEVEAIRAELEAIVFHPERLPGVRQRIGKLPAGADREALEELLAKGEVAIEEARADDDVPRFDDGDAPP